MTFGMSSFSHPRLLLAVLLLAAGVGAALFIWRSRVRVRRGTLISATAAMVLLALTCGGVSVEWQSSPRVTVLVDVSSSTRGAPWRERAFVDALSKRLLGNADVSVREFGAPTAGMSLAAWTHLPEASADAVLLFSDGHLEAPALLPPVYPVKVQWTPVDARVQRLSQSGERVEANLVNTGMSPRAVQWGGEALSLPGSSSQLVTRPMAERVTVQIAAGDLWPENDAAVLPPPLSPQLERWWIGPDVPPGFRAIRPDKFPREPAELLRAGVIVCNDLTPRSLPQGGEGLLARYVRDLGGSVLLISGDLAFSVWRNNPLIDAMPLVPDPPESKRRWTVLVDASGSMAGRGVGGSSRWQAAANAAMDMIGELPAEETVTLGSFASSVQWLSTGSPVSKLLRQRPDFAAISPHGSTDLEPALAALAARDPQATELLVLTDAEVSFKDLPALLQKLRAARMRVSILALGEGRGTSALRTLAQATGGRFMQQMEPARWGEAAGQLAEQAAPGHREASKIPLQWIKLSLPTRQSSPWNRAWAREEAELLGVGKHEDRNMPLAARWNVGLGAAAAAVTPLMQQEAMAVAEQLVRQPSDPSLQVDWSSAAEGRVAVQAVAGGRSLNNLSLSLNVTPLETVGPAVTTSLTQDAPGSYAGTWQPLGIPALATLFREGKAAARMVLPGQAAPEFLHLGMNLPALEELAQRTGGRTLEATSQPLALAARAKRCDLIPFAGSLAGVLLLLTAALLRREPQ